ncbi:collagen-like protein [Chitinophaga sp.]|uniref:collagen-like triple helix repeat-containing protein n=1 Tax=Chitinophaga sp. TaxID=1869181 RepID=UPI0031E42023
MKKVFGYLFVACMFSLTLGMTSCKKGDTGPAGPQGEKGDSGVAGNAGIIYSEWADATFSLASDNATYFVDVDAPKITTDILNNGDVKVYTQYYTSAGELVVMPLPYFNGNYIINVSLFEGGFELYSNADFSSYTDDSGKNAFQYRYVIIPGGKAARKAGIDWNNYEQVKAYLHLKN